MTTPPRRIAIVGNSGSGKSRLAAQIAEATNLPVHHLDQHFWLPGWVQRPPADFDARHAGLIAGDAWVIDGNFARTLPDRADRADLIVFLDLPRWRCLWGVVRRMLTSYGQVRSDMASGCPERIGFEFLRYVWTWDREQRPRTLAPIEAAPDATRVICIKSRHDVAAMWQALGVAPPNQRNPAA